MRLVGCLSFVLLTPLIAQAAVRISEIAWMGTAVSANDEWIELYNSGAAIDVSGWTVSDGDSPLVTLSGVIAPGGYVVLERTNDESAPGPAFLLYTGALKNSGGTLTLRRADGTIVDEVIGGTDWQDVGGSNVTKDTAHRTDTGWVTAPATPGAPPPEVSMRASATTVSAARLAVAAARDSFEVRAGGGEAPSGPHPTPTSFWPYHLLTVFLSLATLALLMVPIRNNSA